MYGDAKMTRHAGDAKGWMLQVTQNIDSWQQRAAIAHQQLLKRDDVDTGKIAAMGYCFGGATVMQLAYTGKEINGVISVHGSMPLASAEQSAKINARVLVLHGASDEFIPAERVQKFTSALNSAGVDWEMDVYGNAKHGFTNPYADGYGMKGLEFNEIAERRSWDRTLTFLEELFSPDELF
jgi:dienelactone hydrolase